MSEHPATRVLHVRGRAVRATILRYRLRIGSRVEELDAAVVRVGSSSAARVVIPDPTISRLHFEIVADGHGFRIRDLGSTNGTYVDGMRIVDGYLRSGSVIQIGKTEVVFEIATTETDVSLATEDSFAEMVGASAPMRALFAMLARVATSEATVLVEGESGTGKELVAEALHASSPRKGRPFVVFDCAAVAATLLESELFGHERGAFTGAQAARIGCFEEADGGTLFLDEIGELPLDLQPKLLRCLESGEVRRVGSTELRRVDVRIIAATNRDLAAEVNAGSFREDLYYRLAVVRLVTPPLRERTTDIPLLVENFLVDEYDGNRARAAAAVANLGERVWKQLASWPWRGNVRELRNAVASAVAFAGDALPTELVPIGGRRVDVPVVASTDESDRSFAELRDEVVASFERDYLTRLLVRAQGKITRAAILSGLDRSYLRRLLRKHRIAHGA